MHIGQRLRARLISSGLGAGAGRYELSTKLLALVRGKRAEGATSLGTGPIGPGRFVRGAFHLPEEAEFGSRSGAEVVGLVRGVSESPVEGALELVEHRVEWDG